MAAPPPSGQNNYKVVVVGASGVGKTSLIQRLTDNIFDTEIQSTVGVEFKSFPCKVGEDDIRLNLWDTAGQEKYRSISKNYFRNALGALLVFAFNDRSSFDQLDEWINELQAQCAPNACIILAGNKADLENDKTITSSEAQKFAEKYSLAFYETSALSDMQVKDSFIRLANDIHMKVKSGEIEGSFTSTSQPPIMVSPEKKSGCC